MTWLVEAVLLIRLFMSCIIDAMLDTSVDSLAVAAGFFSTSSFGFFCLILYNFFFCSGLNFLYSSTE